MLDPDSFSTEAGNIRWCFHTTPRFGQFDIAVPSDDDFNPDASALAHLEAALARIDALYNIALAAAEQGWIARYEATPRPHAAWSLVRLHAHPDGRLVLTLHEGDFDTYCVWDVTLVDDQPATTLQRAYGG